MTSTCGVPSGDADGTRLSSDPGAPSFDPGSTRLAPGELAKAASPIEATTERYKVGDRIGDQYEVLAIHRGTMGVVYATFDHEEKLPRALKTLQGRFAADERMRQLFTEEAAVWVRLEKHPFIARAYLVQKFGGQPYVVTEYVRGTEGRGGDLRSWIGDPRLDLAVAAEMALQIAQGMQHAVRKVTGLVHRDLKPANVLVNDRGQAMVTDFGLVAAQDAQAGTPAYMAPEQWRGESLDPRVDIYSYGCILYELFTGHRLFPAATPEQWNEAHLHAQPYPPRLLNPALPQELEDLVLRCLEKAREQRPSGWDEVVAVAAEWFHRLTGQPAVLEFGAYDLDLGDLIASSYSLIALGRYEEALTSCQRALEIDATEQAAWLNKSIALGLLKRHEDRLQACSKALEIHPEDAKLWRQKGNALGDLKRYEEALVAYDKALAIEPEYANTWYRKGSTLRDLKRYEEALVTYDKVLEIDRRHADAWDDKGRALIRLKRYEEALAAFEKFAEISPTDAEAWRGKGIALYNMKCYEEALTAFDNVSEIEPKDADVWRRKSMVLQVLKRYEESLVACDTALAIDPRNAAFWEHKSEVLRLLKRYEPALTAADTALEFNPNSALAWTYKGRTFWALKRRDEALAAFDQALSLQPDCADALASKATALRLLKERGETGTVRPDVERIADVAEGARERVDGGAWPPEWSEPPVISQKSSSELVRRAATFMKSGRFQEAVGACDEAIALDPTNPEARVLRAKAAGELQRASGLRNPGPIISPWLAKGASPLHPPRLNAHGVANPPGVVPDAVAINRVFDQGIASRRAARHREALESCDRVLAADPRHTAAWALKGLSLADLGRHLEAIAAYESSLGVEPGGSLAAETWHNKGSALMQLKRYQDAVGAFDRAISLNPQLAASWHGRSLCLKQLGRNEEAVGALNRAADLGYPVPLLFRVFRRPLRWLARSVADS